MAVAVARALTSRTHLVVDAGTGVGKSLAYLIPAILFALAEKKKAVVCTHTINLQEQLTQKDLPMLDAVFGALPTPVKFNYAMLKGRANYLCSRRLHKALQHAEQLFSSPEVEELKRVAEWAKQTKDGSRSDFELEPDPRVWAQVCSERGLCSPKICGHQSDFAKDHGLCFFQRARKSILAADHPPESAGCEALRDRLPALARLQLHLFGHIHEAYGQVSAGGRTAVNASICDLRYRPTNPPVLIDL